MKQSTAIRGDLPGGKVCLLLRKSLGSGESGAHEVMSWAGVAERKVRSEATEPFPGGDRSPLITLRDSASSD